MLVDLESRSMRWIDVNLTATGRFHSVGGYRAALAHLGMDLTAAFAHRPTLWDVACLLAAARHPRVLVRDDAGTVAIERRPGESALAFARRLRDSPTEGPEAEPTSPRSPRSSTTTSSCRPDAASSRCAPSAISTMSRGWTSRTCS
jgi:hypothetical protein